MGEKSSNMANQRQETRQRRKKRIRKKVAGTAERPRLTVFRSNKHIYAQVIDDASASSLAAASDLKVAGDDMDEAIINYMKKTYNLTIGEQTSERLKIEIGTAAPVGEPQTMDVRGRDNISGLPRKMVVTSDEIREALLEPVAAIVEAVTRTLERAEPELAADLIDNGICLVGGGSLLRGIDVVFSNATGLDVHVADEPTTCVARGTSIYLEHLEEWKSTMESDMDDL